MKRLATLKRAGCRVPAPAAKGASPCPPSALLGRFDADSGGSSQAAGAKRRTSERLGGPSSPRLGGGGAQACCMMLEMQGETCATLDKMCSDYWVSDGTREPGPTQRCGFPAATGRRPPGKGSPRIRCAARIWEA
jgi:hypothetical protein